MKTGAQQGPFSAVCQSGDRSVRVSRLILLLLFWSSLVWSDSIIMIIIMIIIIITESPTSRLRKGPCPSPFVSSSISQRDQSSRASGLRMRGFPRFYLVGIDSRYSVDLGGSQGAFSLFLLI
ncbi:hypothetical protein C8Q69DRAFT_33062 [Paecilomyces variotii]|uniref:Uncharacterized protein n=1 Tax=Byssochlamys spectabilis TaxID=264951 RepID=A0A443I6S1_BYSSP|nr:hypothetical protein C8Q69DRAFT_33062 [Paecilomyces variotii]RWQ99686.1 hypothetical protein C8Q69DRAFT_33062 [Paecilomyces variotii]